MSQLRKFRIEIPFIPPRELNPNWRGHWAARADAAHTFRHAARVCALSDTYFARPALPRARFSATIFVSHRKYIRDTDNALASLKPAIDGCIDAEIIKDDTPSCLEYSLIKYVIDAEQSPLTVLEFEEVLL